MSLKASSRSGFAEAFTISHFLGQDYADPPPYPFAVTLVGRQVESVRSTNGPAVLPDQDMKQALVDPPDVLMIPGGGGTWPLLDDKGDPAGVAALLDWIRQMDGKVKLMTSVCTGAAVLARAGLLNGLPAATNHGAFAWVTQQGSKVLWDSVSRWIDAGRYVTWAGVSAGTDLGFYLVSRLAGRAVAENAAKAAEYDWHRDPQAPIFYPPHAEA
ncbi:DJ-1/PfpI family protein [Bradyrhizobium sp. CCBAU 65884]|uniref:DJ-1/PfpI family protein n=1 Tax=Bradyrhizobium sp. CCBAU 65884 TaxID=722477 RepID=UPI002305341E|nr:DJ-1/PfpI family protein [Bradyrhizobium sp. CCBAU 65884]